MNQGIFTVGAQTAEPAPLHVQQLREQLDRLEKERAKRMLEEQWSREAHQLRAMIRARGEEPVA
jgi:hypothetical protein